MKYILILLVSFAFGQDIDNIFHPIEDGYGLSNDIGIAEPIRIGHLLDYAEECYNDSVHTFYSSMLTCRGLLDSVDDTTLISTGLVKCWHDSTIYIEHITPTFEGFIDWLKK
ncbi:MAG: hypothetical protein KAS32_04075 [Candidatus Peribacteraceae bacterium]|nr:hypothetical protein [Candidatus Peribacteraceae bacterium]